MSLVIDRFATVGACLSDLKLAYHVTVKIFTIVANSKLDLHLIPLTDAVIGLFLPLWERPGLRRLGIECIASGIHEYQENQEDRDYLEKENYKNIENTRLVDPLTDAVVVLSLATDGLRRLGSIDCSTRIRPEGPHST